MSGANTALLLLGGNLANPEHTFEQALQLIKNRVGKIKNKSSLYWSEPWGFEADHNFLNQVITVSTPLQAQHLLSEVLNIEEKLGRQRNVDDSGYQSRLIDIDILFFNRQIINTGNLTVPHPALHQRKFTLLPLVEIEPEFEHPVFNETLSQLIKKCEDKTAVWKK